MTENEKLTSIFKYLEYLHENTNQSSLSSNKISEHFETDLKVELGVKEANYLCQILIDNKDVIDCSSFDGVCIAYKNSNALVGKKYRDEAY